MGIRVPCIETLKPSNLNHSLISHLCLSLTAHSHLSSLPLSLVAISHHSLLTQSLSQSLSAFLTLPCRHRRPRATQIAARSLNHSLPLSHSALSPSTTMSCLNHSSLSQSLSTSFSLYLVAVAPSPILCHSSTSTPFNYVLAMYFILFNSSFFYVNLHFLANLLCKIICNQLCYAIIACESIYMFVFVNIYSYIWTVNCVFGYLG